MERDLALKLIDILDDIKDAIETIAENTAPADSGGEGGGT